VQKKNKEVNRESIQQRKIQKEKTIGRGIISEELLAEKEIKATEQKALDLVFKLFTQDEEFFTAKDVARVLKLLEYQLPKSKIDLMIWVPSL
jgi:hypothetical protein